MDKSNSLQQFSNFLMNNDKSLLTINSYIVDVKLFLEYYSQFKSITYDEALFQYKYFLLNSKHYKIKTVNRKIISLRQYLKFCGYIVNIKLEKVQEQNFLDDILSKKEIEKIIYYCKANNDTRAKALILTLYYTGMRISECLQVKVVDINKDYIEILGKGKKYRTVFIPKKLQIIWKEYNSVRIPKSDYLFSGQKGAINRYTAHTIIKKYGEKANIDFNKCHCHVLRHVFCKRLAESNVSLDTIADLAGHQSVSTTAKYTRHTKKELLDIINKI